MAFLRTDPPDTLTYRTLTEMLSCVRCETVNTRGMALLKCMHFVCISNDGSSGSTCLDTLRRDNVYICRECEIPTVPEDIRKRRFYTQEVLKFCQHLREMWSDGENVQVRCQRCYTKYHGYVLQSCRTCDQPGLYCLGLNRHCFEQHLEESHRRGAVTFSGLVNDWEAMINSVKMYPEFHPRGPPPPPPRHQRQQQQNPGARAVGHAGAPTEKLLAGMYVTSRYGMVVPVEPGTEFHDPGWIPVLPPVQPQCEALLKVVNQELIELFLIFKKLFHETLGLPSEWKFPRCRTLKTAYTNALYHNQILHVLISGYKENIQAWTEIQPEFSTLSIFKECWDILPNTGVRKTNLMGILTKNQTHHYIIPAITQPPEHVFNEDIKRIITAPNALPCHQTATVEISVFKLEPGPAGYQERKITTRQCMYGEVHELDVQNLPESIRRVKLGKHIYAYTKPSSVNIAMTDEDGVVLKNWMISEDAQSFGEGLWWDGSRLFALLLNTRTVACWTFEKKNCFVARNDITLEERQAHFVFAVNDSLLVHEDTLCVCYNPVRECHHNMFGTSLQCFIYCFNLKTGKPSTGRVPLMLSSPPPITLPLLLGCQHFPHILILDRTQPGNSLIYRAPDESWNKLKFSFDDLQAVHVTDAWLESETCLRIRYETTTTPNEEKMAEEGDAGVASAFPPPPQQLIIKQIRIRLART